VETGELLLTVLGLAGVRLPVLVAVGVGVAWVLGMPRGAVRSGALAGLLLLAISSIVELLLSLLPIWLVNAGRFESISRISDVLGIAHFGLALLQAFGLVLVVWALTRAVRGLAPQLP